MKLCRQNDIMELCHYGSRNGESDIMVPRGLILNLFKDPDVSLFTDYRHIICLHRVPILYLHISTYA